MSRSRKGSKKTGARRKATKKKTVKKVAKRASAKKPVVKSKKKQKPQYNVFEKHLGCPDKPVLSRGKAVPSNPTGCKIILVTVEALLDWVSRGDLIPYKKNRGGTRNGDARVVPALVAQIATDFRAPSTSIIHVVPMVDGRLEAMDGHNQICAMAQRWADGKMSNEQMKQEVAFRVHPRSEALQTYIDCNVHNSHTARNHLLNSDLGFGRLIDEIVSACAPATQKLLKKGTFYPQLAYIMYAIGKGLNRSERTWYYAKVFSVRRDAKRLYCCTPRQMAHLRLGTKQRAELIEAIEYYVAYRKALTAHLRKVGILHNRITRSCGWFAAVVVDRMSKNPRLNPDPKVLAQETLRGFEGISNLVPSITHSSADNITAVTENIIQILNRGGKKH